MLDVAVRDVSVHCAF